MGLFTKFYPTLQIPPSGPVSESFNSDYYVYGPWTWIYRSFVPWVLSTSKFTDIGPNVQSYSRTTTATPAPFTQYLVRFVTPPLKAQTLGGTIDLVLGLNQTNADMQYRYRIVVWVSKGSDYAFNARGRALDYSDPPGRTFPVVSTGWGLATPQLLTPVEILDGDYLIVEVGAVAETAVIAGSPSRRAEITYATMTGPPPAGTEYPDLVVGSTATSTHAGYIVFSQPLSVADAPSNDSCATPLVIPSLPYDSGFVPVERATYDPATDVETTCHAAGDTDEGLYNTVWWQWTATVTGTLRVEGYNAGDTSLTVYTGSCGALTQVACAVGYNGSDPLIKLPVTLGTTYRFRQSGRFYLDGAVYSLKARLVTRPANDDFAARTVITALPYSETSDLTLATSEAGEPNSPTDWTSNPAQSTWYQWTADATPGNIRINTLGSLFDSQITVWTRTPLSTFPVPPATDLYDTFNLPDRATLFNPWTASLSWGGASLGILNHSAVSNRVAPLSAGNYWGNSYGPDCEFWGLIRGTFPSTSDWIGIDAFAGSHNPSSAARNGFWVGAKRDGAGYHAQLGRYTVGLSTTLTDAISPVAITGIGFRRLGTTLYLWVQRAGVWAVEFTTTDTAHAVALRPTIGVMTAAPGNVAFETFGGTALRPWLGDLWIEVFSAPWTNTNGVDEAHIDYEYFDQANMVFRPTPGVTYYITIFSGGGSYWNSYGGSSLSLTISRVPVTPPNETIATAITVGAIPYFAHYDFTGAADGQMELVPLDADCETFTMEQNDSGKVLWFKWTADRSARMNFNTFGAPLGGPFTEVVIYTGTPDALVPLVCDGLNLNNWQTQLFFDAVLGTTYYWRIDSQARIEGPLYFSLDEDYDTFFDGDVVVGCDYIYLFAASGAFRHLVGADNRVPTASGTDPETGLLYQALFNGDKIWRLNGRLELLGEIFTTPGRIPEVPGFFNDGRLFVGHWGLQGTWGPVPPAPATDPSFAIRQFDPDTGALIAVHLAKQELTGTAWIDPAADQRTLVYTSHGRLMMRWDVEAGVQLPDFMLVPGAFPTYEARGLRQRPNGEYLLADRTEVKRISAGGGTVLQTYLIPSHGVPGWQGPEGGTEHPYLDDLNVIDQSPDGSAFWIGDQDSTEVHKVAVATGAILLRLPGGPLGQYGAHNGAGQLCGLSVIGGFRAGSSPPPPPPAQFCPTVAFPVDDVGAGAACPTVDFPVDDVGTPGPIEPPPDPCFVPAGTIMVGGYGDSGTCRYLSPNGATSYPQPPSAPVPGTGLSAFTRLAQGHIGVVGGNAPTFPTTGAGLFAVCDLVKLSEYTGSRQNGFCIAADALGFWYLLRTGVAESPLLFTRLNAASAEVATWSIARPAGNTDSGLPALAVSDDGLTAYCWLAAPFAGNNARVHRFSLAGAGSWVAQLSTDYIHGGPGYNSLLVVPGSGDLLVAFRTLNGGAGALRRYTPSGTLVWTAGTPAGAGALSWQGLALGLPGDTHFLAWGYDASVLTSSNARYCWFSYATGAPDNTRNFTPADGTFEFDSQIVVLMDP